MKFVLLIVAVSGLFAGCGINKSATGLAGLPSAGNVKVVRTIVSESASEVNLEWSIIGDRNWSKLVLADGEIRLDLSYPLNSREKSSGTHLWIINAKIVATGSSESKTGKVNLNVRGSNAIQRNVELPFKLTSGKSIESLVQLVNRTDNLSIPAKLPLLVVGNVKINLVINP